jgi:hypothetical protein
MPAVLIVKRNPVRFGKGARSRVNVCELFPVETVYVSSVRIQSRWRAWTTSARQKPPGMNSAPISAQSWRHVSSLLGPNSVRSSPMLRLFFPAPRGGGG